MMRVLKLDDRGPEMLVKRYAALGLVFIPAEDVVVGAGEFGLGVGVSYPLLKGRQQITLGTLTNKARNTLAVHITPSNASATMGPMLMPSWVGTGETVTLSVDINITPKDGVEDASHLVNLHAIDII